MGKLPAAKIGAQRHLYFWTVEADPSVEREEGKKKLMTALRRHRPEKVMVGGETGETGYRHYHAVTRWAKPKRWEKMATAVARDMAYTKENGKDVSVRLFCPRRGHEDWGDMHSYMSVKKHKAVDGDGNLIVEEKWTWNQTLLWLCGSCPKCGGDREKMAAWAHGAGVPSRACECAEPPGGGSVI